MTLSPVDEWSRALADANLRTADDVTAEQLVKELGDPGEIDADAVCSEALLVAIRDDRSTVTLEDFQTAADELQSDASGDDSDDESAEPEVGVALETAPSETIDTDADAEPSTTDSEPESAAGGDDGTDTGPADDDGDDAAAEADSTATTDDRPPVEEQSRAELETEVETLRDRVDVLSNKVDRLEEVANRDVQLMQAALRELLGPDVIDDPSDLPDAARQFRQEHDTHHEHLGDSDATVSDGGDQLTKIELAKEIARYEAVRIRRKGQSGGAVDYPTVREIAARQHDTDLHSSTVYDAFDRVADEWPCLSVRDGGDGPHSKNKQLRCDREVPQTLLNVVGLEGN